MDGPQDPMRAFNEAWGVLSWTTPGSVRQMLRTAVQQWCQHTCTGTVTPNLSIIESMMYGCWVAVVVDFFRTLDTPAQVCDALTEARPRGGTVGSPTWRLWRRAARRSRRSSRSRRGRGSRRCLRSRHCRRSHGSRQSRRDSPPAGPTFPRGRERRGHPHCCAALRERGSGG